MPTNVQALPMFDGMNIAAESGFVSELEERFRELLPSLMRNEPGSDTYEYIYMVFD